MGCQVIKIMIIELRALSMHPSVAITSMLATRKLNKHASKSRTVRNTLEIVAMRPKKNYVSMSKFQVVAGPVNATV